MRAAILAEFVVYAIYAIAAIALGTVLGLAFAALARWVFP
jgi:hypothetical protein